MLSRLTLRVAAVVLLTVPLATIGGSANAYHTYSPPSDYHLTQGVYGREYWFSSSVTSTTLKNEVYSAKWNWGNAMPGKVAWVATTNPSDSEIDWYQLTTVTSFCGQTNMFNSSNVQVQSANGAAPYANWKYAEILVDPEWNDAGTSCSNGRGILVHEMGHAMGLAHEWPNVAIMRTDINAQGWTAPKVDDENGINHIFY